MLSIGTGEIVVIFLLALVFLGPRRLPELARQIGKIVGELRRTADDLKHTLEDEVREEERQRRLEELRAARQGAQSPKPNPTPLPEVSTPDVPTLKPAQGAVAQAANTEPPHAASTGTDTP